MRDTKPRKPKLSGFAEQLGSGGVPGGAATTSLIESAAVEDPPTAILTGPIHPPVAHSSGSPQNARRNTPRTLALVGLIILAAIVAGPSVALIISWFTFPLIALVVGLAIWKIYELFQSPA